MAGLAFFLEHVGTTRRIARQGQHSLQFTADGYRHPVLRGCRRDQREHCRGAQRRPKDPFQ
jgi:hypothetical protein